MRQKKFFYNNWKFTITSVLYEEVYPLKQKIISTLTFTCGQLFLTSLFLSNITQSPITVADKKALFSKVFDLVYNNKILNSTFGDFSYELSFVSSELVIYLNILL